MTDDLAPPPGPAGPPPAVSVVLPAYNRAGSIRLAIDSVLRQSFADFELIIVDDASTDDTRAIAEAVADPRVRVIAHPANRGASAARNTGVAAARAPFVAFQDSDDEWLPLKLEKQMARLQAPGAPAYVAVYCGMIVLGSHSDLSGRGRARVAYVPDPAATPVEGDIFESLMRTSLASTQTLVVRRDRMLEVGGFDEEMPALIDWECMLRLAPLGPVACVDEPLVIQRFSPNSITREAVKRAHARARAVARHRDRLARHPAAHAGLLYAVAGGLGDIGETGAAARALAEAARITPLSARIRAMQAYVALLALRARLGGGRPAG